MENKNRLECYNSAALNAKLNYLTELRQMKELHMLPEKGINLLNRINRVMDSIENDLGLSNASEKGKPIGMYMSDSPIKIVLLETNGGNG